MKLTRTRRFRKYRWLVEFKKEDCWIGVFWKKDWGGNGGMYRYPHVWICLVPMFPIHVWWIEVRGRA